jgi:hypothetical protein
VADRAGRRHQADGVAAERGRELPDGTRPMAWPIVLAAERGRWRGRELPDGTRPMAWPIVLADLSWPLSVADGTRPMAWPLSVADRAGRVLADGRWPMADGRWRGR